MHRQPALGLVRAHAAQPLEAAEAATAEQTSVFIAAETNCLLRTCAPGHLTGSAWIVSPDRREVLLTHHQKLGKWLQLGGHADGETDLLGVARREALEESGLTRLVPLSAALFDLDRHWIPPRRDEPGHWHYDFRFLFEADPREPLILTHESKELGWVELSRVTQLNPEESMARMVRKSPR